MAVTIEVRWHWMILPSFTGFLGRTEGGDRDSEQGRFRLGRQDRRQSALRRRRRRPPPPPPPAEIDAGDVGVGVWNRRRRRRSAAQEAARPADDAADDAAAAAADDDDAAADDADDDDDDDADDAAGQGRTDRSGGVLLPICT